MARLTYYIVNHTTREYCGGEPRDPIFIALDKVLAKYHNWRRNDNIVIMPEDTSSMQAAEYLAYSVQYKNLDD
jgi:hypothetical protein